MDIEPSVMPMLKLAREVAASLGIGLPEDPHIVFDRDAGLTWYTFDVPRTVEVVRSLSLKYEDQLFSRLPSAPLRYAHVGFESTQ